MDTGELLEAIARAAAIERERRGGWQFALGMRNALIRQADAVGVPQVDIARAAGLKPPSVLRIAAGDGRGGEPE
jgi:hypothetical protein